MIEHYDGSAWTTSVTLPGIRLSGITSISPTQAWAVGTGPDGTATVRWDGSSWTVVPSPNPRPDDGLTAVSGVAGGDVWAVGSEVDFSPGVGYAQPIAMHWNGTAWTAVPAIGVAPDFGGFTGTFLAVVAVTSSRVIAAGFAHGQGQSLIAHVCAFAVRDTGFAASPVKVSAPGAAAYWVFPASNAAGHDLADGSGFGMFDSGTKGPGSSYAFTFPASGTWPVTDTSTGAHQSVAVPVLITPGRNDNPALWFATAQPPAGARFEIQDIPPGGTTFTRFGNTKQLTWTLSKQLPRGTYTFRTRLRNPTTGAATGWSPARTITLR
jgi:hypothetical protein